MSEKRNFLINFQDTFGIVIGVISNIYILPFYRKKNIEVKKIEMDILINILIKEKHIKGSFHILF